MDPLAALSVVAAVIQFVDFGLRLVSDGAELYERGSVGRNDELELIARDLTRLTDDIVAAPTHWLDSSEDEAALKKAAGLCQEIGNELLSHLEKLRVQPSGNRLRLGLDSFRKSLRNVRKRNKTQSIETRLKRARGQVKMNVLNLLSKESSRVHSLLNDLQDECRQNQIENENKLRELRTEILKAIDRADLSRGARTREAFGRIRTYCLELAQEGRNLDKSRRVLSSLKQTTFRESAIKEAYGDTFDWIFGENVFQKEGRLSFIHWLRQGHGIYWISGKAGSGKSTLMKALRDTERTKTALEVWAGKAKLITASFFFWGAGGMTEKSHQGLLQSILHQIVEKSPELLPTICPSRWQFNDTDHQLDGSWTHAELNDCFRRLRDQVLPAKFCFLIDGLDEYDGDEREIITTLQDLTLSPSIKICASSRPWNAFDKAFGNNLNQKLRLQDYTKNDIRLYARGKLEEDPSFSMKAAEDYRYNQLIDDIVERASGVFLWVYLVVRSLLRGLTDENDFAFMRRRLDHFPSDLGDYFRQILNNSEEIYAEPAARIFLILLNRKFQGSFALTALSFDYLEKILEDPKYALDRNVVRISNEEGFMISERRKLYLNACCKDLVEVTLSFENKGFAFMEFNVEFLHRTVKDFLLREDIFSTLNSNAGSEFDPKIALCRTILAQLKGLPECAFTFPNEAAITIWIQDMVDDVKHLAKEAGIPDDGNPNYELLNELEYTRLDRGVETNPERRLRRNDLREKQGED